MPLGWVICAYRPFNLYHDFKAYNGGGTLMLV